MRELPEVVRVGEGQGVVNEVLGEPGIVEPHVGENEVVGLPGEGCCAVGADALPRVYVGAI